MTQVQSPGSPNDGERTTAAVEIDLVTVFLFVWHRKKIILLLTLLLTLTVAGITFFLPDIYRVSAVIEPSVGVDEKPVITPQSLREQILSGVFTQRIVANNEPALLSAPVFQVRLPKATNLLIVSFEAENPELAAGVMEQLLTEIAADNQSKLTANKQQIESELQAAKLKQKLYAEQIKSLVRRLHQAEQRLPVTGELLKDQAAKKVDPLPQLLMQNDLQIKQLLHSNLENNLLGVQIRNELNDVAIDSLRAKLNHVKVIDIRQKPGVPQQSVRPNRLKLIIATFFGGLLGSILLVFIVDFLRRVQLRLHAE